MSYIHTFKIKKKKPYINTYEGRESNIIPIVNNEVALLVRITIYTIHNNTRYILSRLFANTHAISSYNNKRILQIHIT